MALATTGAHAASLGVLGRWTVNFDKSTFASLFGATPISETINVTRDDGRELGFTVTLVDAMGKVEVETVETPLNGQEGSGRVDGMPLKARLQQIGPNTARIKIELGSGGSNAITITRTDSHSLALDEDIFTASGDEAVQHLVFDRVTG